MIMHLLVHVTNKNISNKAVIATSLRCMEKKGKANPFCKIIPSKKSLQYFNQEQQQQNQLT